MSVEYISQILTTWDNNLGTGISKLVNEGWEMVGEPRFMKNDEPYGWNRYAIGLHPHFLVLFKREVGVSLPQAKSDVGGSRK